jgi:hypothetical protein
MPQIKVSAYDSSGKQHVKSFNTNIYSDKEIEALGREWRRCIHTGTEFKASFTPEVKEIFERKPFTFEMPTNGGVSFALVGSTRCGKSTMMVYLVEKFFKKHIKLLFTLSPQADIYKKMKVVVVPGFKKELIEEPMKLNRHTNNKYKFLHIFDDMAMEGKTTPEMTKLLTIGRNSGMSAIISGQKLTMLSATGRSNVNIICCFKQNTDSAIEDTIKNYLKSYFPSGTNMIDMIKLYKEYTEDHHFICVDTLNDKIFISKIDC